MKNIITRTLSGLIYCAIIIAAVWFGADTTALLAILFSVLGIIEYIKISGGLTRNRIPVILLDVAGSIALSMWAYILPLLFWVCIVIIRSIMELYLNEESPLKSLAYSIFGQIYIAAPLGCLVAFPEWLGCETGRMLLALFFLIWINDTGAFIVGCSIGKHRLFERISPKKSWEGFFGGLIFSVAAAWLFGTLCPDFFGFHGSLPMWGIFAIIVTVFSTWGDLIESMIKRTLHIKDSGNIIPGHGGILDRIDSLLLAAPAAFIFLMLL